jgi:hypothetical protein
MMTFFRGNERKPPSPGSRLIVVLSLKLKKTEKNDF